MLEHLVVLVFVSVNIRFWSLQSVRIVWVLLQVVVCVRVQVT